jgi:hypothetical protein
MSKIILSQKEINQKEYLSKILGEMDEETDKEIRKNMFKSIRTDCRCGVSTTLYKYFKHCDSKKHIKYFKNNNITNMYCIIDSNIDLVIKSN